MPRGDTPETATVHVSVVLVCRLEREEEGPGASGPQARPGQYPAAVLGSIQATARLRGFVPRLKPAGLWARGGRFPRGRVAARSQGTTFPVPPAHASSRLRLWGNSLGCSEPGPGGPRGLLRSGQPQPLPSSPLSPGPHRLSPVERAGGARENGGTVGRGAAQASSCGEE